MESGFTRDEWDRKAHDILCIIKYGSVGGGIRAEEMYKVSDILRGHPYRPTLPPLPVVTPPVVALPPVPVVMP